jgi:hypothetical protein
VSNKRFTPKIQIINGEVEGYGGPGYYWTKGVYDNRRLYSVKSYGEADAAIQGERERIKWEKPWPNKDAFRKAISRKPLDSPLCSNCGKPTGEGGSSCLDRYWCDKQECRDALEAAREQYRKDQEAFKINAANKRERERQEDVAKLDNLTTCFHLRDGWYFRREENGAVRIMHRETPTSHYLSTDLTIPAEGWASIVCSVSIDGETGERWQAALEFHGAERALHEGEK